MKLIQDHEERSDLTETERERAFCNHTIMGKSSFVVTDLSKDPRFQHFPDVRDSPHYRFYAGSPIFLTDRVSHWARCV